MAQFVKLNPKANFFKDPITGFQILPNEVKELTVTSPRIKAAIQGGHLMYTEAPDSSKEFNEDELFEQFKKDFDNKVDDSKLLRLYKKAQLEAIASKLEIEVEEGDTAKTILEAIKEELTPEA
jgi:hypothetical protein